MTTSPTRSALVDPQLFKHGVRQVAAVMGRSKGLRVTFEGVQPATSKEEMILPAIDDLAPLTQRQLMATRGFVYHESGHVARTDFECWEGAHEEGGGMLVGMLNGVEDVRLDAETVRTYAGALDAIKTAFEEMLQQALDRYPPGADEWMQPGMIPAAIGAFGRDEAGIHPLNLPEYEARFPAALVPKLREWGRRSATCRSTQEALSLAKAIMAELELAITPPPKGDGGDGSTRRRDDGTDGMGGSGADGDGDASDGEGAGGGEGAGKDDRDRPSKGGDSEGGEPGRNQQREQRAHVAEAVDRVETVDKAAGGGLGADAVGVHVPLEKLAEAMRELDWRDVTSAKPIELSLDVGKLLKAGTPARYAAVSTRYDAVFSRRRRGDALKLGGQTRKFFDAFVGTAESRALYRQLVASVRGQLGVAQRALEGALRHMNRRDTAGGFLEGRLDPRAFARVIAQLDTHAFRQKVRGRELNTAVQVIVDLSGSMSGVGKDIMARITTIVLAEVLERIRVPFEVVGFNSATWAGFSDNAGAAIDLGGGATHEGRSGGLLPLVHLGRAMRERGYEALRVDPLNLWLFKEFDEALTEAHGSLASMTGLVHGNNVDGESIYLAATRLLQRPEERKVCLVLSDGQPACRMSGMRGAQALADHLHQTVRELTKDGVEMVGVGMLDHSVQRYYPDWVVVDDINTLGTTVMRKIGDILLKRNRRRAA